MTISRRHFLRSIGVGAAAVGLGCSTEAGTGSDAGAQTDAGALADAGLLDATPQCFETRDDIEGPFYRADAPFRADLTEPGMAGTRLTITGRVLSTACLPLAGAVVDLWQASDSGNYDNDGSSPPPPPNVFVLRGRQTADADGNFTFRTIIPGRYLNGNQFRPAHLHVKVSAAGHAELTTQLYFDGDPYNDVDPWFHPALSMALSDAPGGEKSARFDFVLT